MYFIVFYSRTPRIQHPRSAETQCSPVVLFGVSNESLTRVVPGVTHIYTTQSEPHRTYHLHFVTLSGLAERQRYFYRVRAGKDPNSSPVSKLFSFRAGYTSGQTVVDLCESSFSPFRARICVCLAHFGARKI